ncbi:MAG: NlpC/P60 family protein [Proteobacteria bacterium]|nr:NlpC/P60 family protein [Pseudomonadota bacterium]
MNDQPLDPREHPFRESVAASYLQGKVDAERFVDGQIMKVTAGVAPLRGAPEAAASRISELLFGENFTVYDRIGPWAWGQCQTDGYVGFAPADGLAHDTVTATHEVSALRTYAFEKPDLKSWPVTTLHMTSRLAVSDEAHGYCLTDAGGWVSRRHLMQIGAGAGLADTKSDLITAARCFLGAPYLWGGRSSLGVDCSGLVQLALMRSGRSAPRDSDQQERCVGAIVENGIADVQAGDLLFMKGHVVVVSGPDRVLHANAHHMCVAEEPLDRFLARVAAMGLAITTVRRL